MESIKTFKLKDINENKYLNKVKRFFHFGNRTFADYNNFLEQAKNNGFEFVPLKDFVKPRVPNEKIIGLRHDVDSELDHAIKIAEIEHAAGVKATYFILHTAAYYSSDVSTHKINDKLIEKLLYLQNILGHEVGLHIDLMPIEIVYRINPVDYLKKLLSHLRMNGIQIFGVAPHGNLFHHIYRGKFKSLQQEVKNINIFANPYVEFDKQLFDLDYEAYSLEYDNYLSDAQFINDKRWDFSSIKNNFFQEKGRTVILTHTIHWAPSKIYYYTVNFTITVRYFFSYLNEYIKYRRVEKATGI